MHSHSTLGLSPQAPRKAHTSNNSPALVSRSQVASPAHSIFRETITNQSLSCLTAPNAYRGMLPSSIPASCQNFMTTGSTVQAQCHNSPNTTSIHSFPQQLPCLVHAPAGCKKPPLPVSGLVPRPLGQTSRTPLMPCRSISPPTTSVPTPPDGRRFRVLRPCASVPTLGSSEQAKANPTTSVIAQPLRTPVPHEHLREHLEDEIVCLRQEISALNSIRENLRPFVLPGD